LSRLIVVELSLYRKLVVCMIVIAERLDSADHR